MKRSSESPATPVATDGTVSEAATSNHDVLTDVLRSGALQLLTQAIEAEVAVWIDGHEHLVDCSGHRVVVRNGHMPSRSIVTSVGSVEVTQPRVHDRRPADSVDEHGQPVEELIPWLYLKGVSTGDFTEALQALLGPDAAGLSATTITRLISTWQGDYEAWSKRSLKDKQYVYLWADGVHFNIRLEEDRQCILVLMGARADGKKELIAVADGYRESEQSWRQLLLDCKQRGLVVDPKLATGDGALRFWKAMRQVYPTTRTQRCWVHKTVNVLDKMPKRAQPKAKDMLHEIWMAPSRADAEQAFDAFIEMFRPKYPKAADCLTKDRDALLTF